MSFKLAHTLKLLAKTPAIIEYLLIDIPEEWIYQNEGPETWSPYNILGHLIHGERTDWIARAKIILSNSKGEFEPYDRTAQERLDQTVPHTQLLKEFRQLRKENLAEVNTWNINENHLSLTAIHPGLGEVTLQELFATWLVHDYSHLHQITRVLGKNYMEEVGPWSNYINMLGSKKT